MGSRTLPLVAGATAVFTLLLPARALAQGAAPNPVPARTGKNCLDQPRAKVVADHALLLSLNPTGHEHQVEAATCLPLVQRPGVLFDYTNLKLGALAVTSLVYHHQGLFLSVSPLSLLEFRAEAHGVMQWPLAIQGAGYYPRLAYGDDNRGATMPAGGGGYATGWNVVLKTIGRVKVDVGPVALIATDTLGLEVWEIGRRPYYFNQRKDLTLARRDVMLTNSALFLVEAGLPWGWALRVGVMDELAVVPRAAYLRHRVSAVATVSIPRAGGIMRGVQPFTAVGIHTHHALRAQQPFAVLGLGTSYDLL